MTVEIHIPDWCYTPKPYFKTRPNQELVEQIKNFIKQSGTPHLWPGHTHTPPVKGARIEYLDDYDLPEAHQNSKANWAPCPCCSPRRPKYYKGGKIGWFPDEGVIRNMGPDCFAAFDKEGHLRAVAQLRKEQRSHRITNLLSTNLPKLPAALCGFEEALPVVEAIDDVRKSLRKNLPLILKADLWKHIQGGELRVKGQMFSVVAGYKMLDPNEPPLATGLKKGIDTLREIQLQLGSVPDAAIAQMSDDEREEMVRALGRSLNRGAEIFEAADNIRDLCPKKRFRRSDVGVNKKDVRFEYMRCLTT